MSNSFGPDQARRFVMPDLGLDCLQRLSASDNVVATSWERVNSVDWVVKLQIIQTNYLEPKL